MVSLPVLVASEEGGHSWGRNRGRMFDDGRASSSSSRGAWIASQRG